MADKKELVLKAEAGGKTREFLKSKLELIDKKKPSVRLHFLRYGAFRKKSELLRVQAPIEDNGKFEPAKMSLGAREVVVTGKSSFSLSNFTIHVTNLFRGYVYLFDANDPNLWYEFKVLEDGRIHDIVWNSDSPRGERLPNGAIRDYFPLKYDKTVWVCYSPVQWSPDFHISMRTEASKKKYMKKISCTGFFRDNSSDHRESSNYKQIDAVFYKEQDSLAEDLSKKLENIHKYESNPANIMECDYMLDMFIPLRDPISIADEIAFHIKDEIVRHRAMIGAMQIGMDEEVLYNRMKAGDYDKRTLTPQHKEILAMVTLAKTIRSMVYKKGGSKKYDGGEIGGWKSGLHKKKLLNILGVEERKIQRNKIFELKNDLGAFIFSDYYQDSYQVHLDGSVGSIVSGKHTISEHLDLLAINPHNYDREFDLVEDYYETEDPWIHKVNGTLGTGDSAMYKVLNKKVDLSDTLLNDWPNLANKAAAFVKNAMNHYASVAMRDIEIVTKLDLKYKILNRYKLLLVRFNTITYYGEEIFTIVDSIVPVGSQIDLVDVSVHKSVKRGKGKPVISYDRKISYVKTGAPAIVTVEHPSGSNSKFSFTKDSFIQIEEVEKNVNHAKGVKIKGVVDSRGFAGTLAILQVFNLNAAMKTVGSVRNAKETVNLVGVTGEMVEAIANLATVSMRNAPKFLGRIAVGAGAVGSVVTVAMCGWEAKDSIAARDHDAALAWIGAGVAFSASSIAMFSAAALAGPVGWIAAGIGIGFIVLAHYFTDTPLEEFFKNIAFSDDEKYVKNPKLGVGLNNFFFYIDRYNLTSSDKKYQKWADFNYASAYFFDIIVGGNIYTIVDPNKITNKKKKYYEGSGGQYSSPHTTISGLIKELSLEISFRMFFVKKEQLEYHVFFYKEGVKHSAPKKLNLSGNITYIAKTNTQPARASIAISIDEEVTRNSVLLIACRLSIGDAKYYPARYNGDRYVGVITKLIYNKDDRYDISGMHSYVSNRSSNVRVDTLYSLKFGDWK